MASIEIPGPLRSFLRMAGISQEITPADVMPLLARNAFLYGHQVGEKDGVPGAGGPLRASGQGAAAAGGTRRQ